MLLGLSFLCTLLDLFSNYELIYYYLPDVFGYSLFTNLFMTAVYCNKKYCSSIKVAVFGLITMNIFTLLGLGFGFYSIWYNIILELIILTVVVSLIIKKK